jgi:hypothetical protein
MVPKKELNLLTLLPEILTQICRDILAEISFQKPVDLSETDEVDLLSCYTAIKSHVATFQTCHKLHEELSAHLPNVFFSRQPFNVLIMPSEPGNTLRKQALFLEQHGGKICNISLTVKLYSSIDYWETEAEWSDFAPGAHECRNADCPAPTYTFPDLIEECRIQTEDFAESLLQRRRQDSRLKLNFNYFSANPWAAGEAHSLTAQDRDALKQKVLFQPLEKLGDPLEEFIPEVRPWF